MDFLDNKMGDGKMKQWEYHAVSFEDWAYKTINITYSEEDDLIPDFILDRVNELLDEGYKPMHIVIGTDLYLRLCSALSYNTKKDELIMPTTFVGIPLIIIPPQGFLEISCGKQELSRYAFGDDYYE